MEVKNIAKALEQFSVGTSSSQILVYFVLLNGEDGNFTEFTTHSLAQQIILQFSAI